MSARVRVCACESVAFTFRACRICGCTRLLDLVTVNFLDAVNGRLFQEKGEQCIVSNQIQNNNISIPFYQLFVHRCIVVTYGSRG